MTDKKYKIRRDLSMEYAGHNLYRIEALKNFGHIIAGDIGGYIEKEDNLSHYYSCWIHNNAKVMDDARVHDNAQVCNEAVIKEDAEIFDEVTVFDKAIISGNVSLFHEVEISNSAIVSGNAFISEYATINRRAQVYDNAKISGNALITNHAIVKGNCYIMDNAIIKENAIVQNDAIVSGSACIAGMLTINNVHDIIVLGPIGSRDKYITFVKQDDDIYIKDDSIFGTIKQFSNMIKGYEHCLTNERIINAIEFVKKQFEIIDKYNKEE